MCETCFTIQETDTFQSFLTKEVYKINHIFIVIVHVLFTLFLLKYLAYSMLGQQLTDSVRWNNYKCSQRIASEGATPKQNYFHQHFLSDIHHGLLQGCEIGLIEKTDPSNLTRSEFF